MAKAQSRIARTIELMQRRTGDFSAGTSGHQYVTLYL
jgi:hypothetical protein